MMSSSEPLEVQEDLWKVGLTPIVHHEPVVAEAITKAAEGESWLTASGDVIAQHALVAPVAIPKPSLPQAEFDALQKWEGHVIAVNGSEFTASLTDLTSPGGEEEAVLELSEVSDDDLELVQPGAVFYWSVGYRIEPSGERSRSSVIWFRRLPAWTARDVEQVSRSARELKERLGL